MSFIAGASAPPPPDPRIGQLIGERYRVVQKIGEGGMGDVYEARQLALDRPVAVKILHAAHASRTDVVRRFEREAQAASNIAHPNIAQVTDLGRTPDGCPFMVLEYLAGRDLARELEVTGPMPTGRIVRIALQVCSALAATHARGIVHRDLKPENLFLTTHGAERDVVKVLDFGISKFQDVQAGSVPMTMTGTALGTPYYMSPEQIQARKDLDGRADIWSLGVILYRALACVYPFDADNLPMLFLRICTEEPTPLVSFRPDVPAALSDAVARMLRKVPAERFATFDEVRAALEPYRDLDQPPALRDEAAVRRPQSMRPGGLAPGSTRADSLVSTQYAGGLLPPPVPTVSAEDTRRLLDAGLSLRPMAPDAAERVTVPTRAAKPGAPASARDEQGSVRDPNSSMVGDGVDAFAPAGSWLADPTARAAGPSMELAVPTPRTPPRPATPRRTPDHRVAQAESQRLVGVLVRAFGVTLLVVAVGMIFATLSAPRAVGPELDLTRLPRDVIALVFLAAGSRMSLLGENAKDRLLTFVVLTLVAAVLGGLGIEYLLAVVRPSA